MPAPVFVAAAANFSSAHTVSAAVVPGAASGRCILALASAFNAVETPDSATFNSVAMTVGPLITQASGKFARAFWLANNDAGIGTTSATCTATFSGGTPANDVFVVAYSGVSAVSGVVIGAASSTTPSWTVASAVGDLVVALIARAHIGGMSSSPSSPAISRYSNIAPGNVNWFDNDLWDEAGASSVTIDGTIESSNSWFGFAISLAAVGGGGGGGGAHGIPYFNRLIGGRNHV